MYTICIGVYIRIQHYQHYQLLMLDIYIYIYIYIYPPLSVRITRT